MRPEEPTASGVSGDTYVYSGGLSASFGPLIPHLSIYIPASCFLTQQSEVLFIFSKSLSPSLSVHEKGPH